MNIDEEIFKKLDEWVFNVETQAGEKLHVIDAIDLKEIVPEIIEVVKKFNYIPCCKGEAEQLVCSCGSIKIQTTGGSQCPNNRCSSAN